MFYQKLDGTMWREKKMGRILLMASSMSLFTSNTMKGSKIHSANKLPKFSCHFQSTAQCIKVNSKVSPSLT